MYKKDKRRRL